MKEEWCVENMRMILFDMREISAFFAFFSSTRAGLSNQLQSICPGGQIQKAVLGGGARLRAY